MKLSVEYLEKLSAETGFQIVALEKVIRLGELASGISSHPFLMRNLILKGGTALNLGFGKSGRLSVDLDYNYIGKIDREDMRKERPVVEQAVITLSSRLGYRIQQSRDAYAGRKIYLCYRSAVGTEDRIEIDLNYLFRVPLFEPDTIELWQPGEHNRPKVKAVNIRELVAGKINAFIDRCSARDVWDVASFSPEVIAMINEKEFKSHFIVVTGSLIHPLPTYHYKRLAERLSQQDINTQLIPMLADGVQIEAEKMLSDAWSIIKHLLELSSDQTKFVNNLNNGILDMGLLFPEDKDKADKLSKHPALLWKLMNVQYYRGG